MSSAVILGLGLAAVGLVGRYGVRIAGSLKGAPFKMPEMPRLPQMPNIPIPKFIDLNGYYKGGFDATMTKFEAGKILGVSPSAPRDKINDAHKRVIKAIHPDRGGSPYLAAKVNDAKRLLDGK